MNYVVSKKIFRGLLLGLALFVSLSASAFAQARLSSHYETDGARIVVNFPAYRLYLYHGDKLIKSYRVGIGMNDFKPVFGEMLTREIVYNPSWSPPASPWARKYRRYGPGEAGNPLGRVKLPLYGLYLIHGGAHPSHLGRAVSHGCVRMLNRDVLDLVRRLAAIQNGEEGLTQAKRAERVRRRSVPVKFDEPVVVDFRYDLATVEDGQIRVYPDVYRFEIDREKAVETALTGAGFSWDDLSDKQRDQLTRAIKQTKRNHTIVLTEDTVVNQDKK